MSKANARSRPAHGVAFPEGATGSTFLHSLLTAAVEKFPQALTAAALPAGGKVFKETFGDAVTRFEAARVASSQRVDIACAVRAMVTSQMRLVDARGTRPLLEALRADTSPERAIPVRVMNTMGAGRLVPSVTVDGAPLVGSALTQWICGKRDEHHMNDAAAQALLGLVGQAGTQGLSLRGERFVLLGAGAELAPTAELLAAGATVLWLDLKPPPAALLASLELGGELHVPEHPCNLLEDPVAACATVAAFAAQGPVHLGMYAYAGGESQEWRLAEAMNAIALAQAPGSVKSVSVLISPTSVMAACAADVTKGHTRRKETGPLVTALGKASLMGESHVRVGDAVVPVAVVALQGASYLAAQYVGKTLCAEALGVRGLDGGGPLRVSANVAPITATRSLSHPVFEAGFLFAHEYGVWISRPEVTRAMHALLMMADVTEVHAPSATERNYTHESARAAAILGQQVHGGVFAQPYRFEGMIRVSAVRGLLSRPSLLVKALAN
jgi:hypothetical protein